MHRINEVELNSEQLGGNETRLILTSGMLDRIQQALHSRAQNVILKISEAVSILSHCLDVLGAFAYVNNCFN